MIIATGVYIKPSPPNGPERHKSTATISPATTGGIPIPVFAKATTADLPLKGINAMAKPIEAPSKKEMAVEIEHMIAVRPAIIQTSSLPPKSTLKNFEKTSYIRSIIHSARQG
tara:strand:- start:1685 stop:2023 length:339 start_codon:yes stop_codon:yes gene_type:complete